MKVEKINSALIRVLLLASSCVLLISCGGGGSESDAGQSPDVSPSMARTWNEVLLSAIRRDLARPTVHARNLFHSAALMYDAWAVFDTESDTYFLGSAASGESCELTQQQKQSYRDNNLDIQAAREETIAVGMYRLLRHRFQFSPGRHDTYNEIDRLIERLGYDIEAAETDLDSYTPAALGVYLADCIITYGLSDGANEQNNYANRSYQPVNQSTNPEMPGITPLADPDRWQPLSLEEFIDQSGNPAASEQPFLGAEWGSVLPFALNDDVCSTYLRGGQEYRVCHDPGVPALLSGENASPDEYRWNHRLVVLWSAHLDPADGVMWDISPASTGNAGSLPVTLSGLRLFYREEKGGVNASGHGLNPATNEPYEPQVVPRGDYTRVLAEFWADGPDSETPPGHWFTIANEAVNDHPAFQRRYKGEGEELGPLEWDVKLYLMLGAAMHDAAITAWGIKGWYDYIRPLSAIRYMSRPGKADYDASGMQQLEGRVEIVEPGDPLAGNTNEHVGKIKVMAWRGPGEIQDPRQDVAGVGWILAENWWPYQRPTFVTPPFAGYISGHSTFSRAAAEVLTYITGNEYFPGGMGEFLAKKNEFLVFEKGPSVDVRLQWATYRDASDQTSLSRIWGGIHPPVDDIPGRIAGVAVASQVISKAEEYFRGESSE